MALSENIVIHYFFINFLLLYFLSRRRERHDTRIIFLRGFSKIWWTQKQLGESNGSVQSIVDTYFV